MCIYNNNDALSYCYVCYVLCMHMLCVRFWNELMNWWTFCGHYSHPLPRPRGAEGLESCEASWFFTGGDGLETAKNWQFPDWFLLEFSHFTWSACYFRPFSRQNGRCWAPVQWPATSAEVYPTLPRSLCSIAAWWACCDLGRPRTRWQQQLRALECIGTCETISHHELLHPLNLWHVLPVFDRFVSLLFQGFIASSSCADTQVQCQLHDVVDIQAACGKVVELSDAQRVMDSSGSLISWLIRSYKIESQIWSACDCLWFLSIERSPAMLKGDQGCLLRPQIRWSGHNLGSCAVAFWKRYTAWHLESNVHEIIQHLGYFFSSWRKV